MCSQKSKACAQVYTKTTCAPCIEKGNVIVAAYQAAMIPLYLLDGDCTPAMYDITVSSRKL